MYVMINVMIMTQCARADAKSVIRTTSLGHVVVVHGESALYETNHK